VNGRIVPLRYTLKSGDTIEVMTSPTHDQAETGLNLLSRNEPKQIRQWIKAEERKQAEQLGLKLLEGEMKRHDSALRIEIREDAGSLTFFNSPSFEELSVSIGYGRLSAHQIVNKLMPERAAEEVLL